jgi:hypothetical protein
VLKAAAHAIQFSYHYAVETIQAHIIKQLIKGRARLPGPGNSGIGIDFENVITHPGAVFPAHRFLSGSVLFIGTYPAINRNLQFSPFLYSFLQPICDPLDTIFYSEK